MKLLVIGRTGVIGGVIARHRHGLGDEVVGLSRSDTIQADVTSVESLVKASAQIEPDALVFCAGIHGWVGPVESSPIKHAARAIEVNLIGALNCISVFNDVRRMIFLGGGGAGYPRPRYAAYAASKAGLVRLVETVALEQPELSINVVAPGAIRSPLTVDRDDAREFLPEDRLLALIDRLLDGSPVPSGKFIHYLDPWETWTTKSPEGMVLRRT